jgi:hypothetical protein
MEPDAGAGQREIFFQQNIRKRVNDKVHRIEEDDQRGWRR